MPPRTPPDPPRPKSLTAALAVYTERPTLVMIALGFAGGLPFYLIFDTLSAWLREDGLNLAVIGYFSLATLVYSFKFLWAPLLDRTSVPFLTARLGHRRSWMLVTQLCIVIGLWLIAGQDPASDLGTMAALAILTGVCGATQDVVIDAWRIEAADQSRQGAMAAAYQWGYRLALLAAGALPLVIAQYYSWQVSYAVMAMLMTIGMAAALLAPREAQHRLREVRGLEGVRVAPAAEAAEWMVRLTIVALGALLLGSGLAANADALSGFTAFVGLAGVSGAIAEAWRSSAAVWVQFASVVAGFVVLVIATRPVPGVRTRPGAYLAAALGDPIRDFLVRYRGTAALILALICGYRLPDFVLNIMNPFYLDVGFTLVEVAEVRKIFGVVATMSGVFLGGLAVARLGMMRALIVGAFGGPLSNLVFIWLAARGHDLPSLFVAIGVENVTGGFAGTCLIAYMSSLTSAGFTATQYALFSSLYALPGRLIASQSGRLVEAAARAAEAGGALGLSAGMFANLPAGAFAESLDRSGVSPSALATGYAVFFTYSAAIGIAALVLSFVVAAREREMRVTEDSQ
ncbi:MAG: AmpG family muropeptide MFS transporter [Acidimicrobiia bacterium]|nr:AmpG family muropeptide MFS transporter [Acidimicrobiia bacterium]